jgi:seryl-tRNA synthetase
VWGGLWNNPPALLELEKLLSYARPPLAPISHWLQNDRNSQNAHDTANDAMDQIQRETFDAIIRNRKHALMAEMRESKAKLDEIDKMLQQAKMQFEELTARLSELNYVEILLLTKSENGEVGQFTSARASQLIISALESCPFEGGATLAQLSLLLPIPKQHISSTLYNLKKRNMIVHSEATGLYRIAKASAESAFNVDRDLKTIPR